MCGFGMILQHGRWWWQ